MSFNSSKSSFTIVLSKHNYYNAIGSSKSKKSGTISLLFLKAGADEVTIDQIIDSDEDLDGTEVDQENEDPVMSNNGPIYLSSCAPENHASNKTTYGIASENNYGHIKVKNGNYIKVSDGILDGTIIDNKLVSLEKSITSLEKHIDDKITILENSIAALEERITNLENIE